MNERRQLSIDVFGILFTCAVFGAWWSGQISHCVRGHEFTQGNMLISKNGSRRCRECRRAYDRGRRDASFGRAYRARKRGRV